MRSTSPRSAWRSSPPRPSIPWSSARFGPRGWIQVASPSGMEGYTGPGATEADPFDGRWLRTGDLGYQADGELFFTGRSKDIVVVMGRNYAAEDLEWAAERTHGLRVGRVVAF